MWDLSLDTSTCLPCVFQMTNEFETLNFEPVTVNPEL